MIVKTFKATPKLVETIGKKWAGTYKVRQLNSREYIAIGDELIEEMRKLERNILDVPQAYANEMLVFRCTTHNEKPLERPLPSKLLELLLVIALELNTISLDERRDIFLQPVTTQKKNRRRLGKQSREVSEKTKETVLKAALKIFAREGFHNAKLREISDLAGTTHSLIRHHFGSKDDLWKAVVDYGLNLHERSLLRILKSRKSTDAVELFKGFIASYVSTIASNPELSKILLHDNSRSSPHLDYLIERQKQLHAIIEPVFKNVQKAGYFEAFDHDSFLVYVRALVETPIATRDISNQLLGRDILSKKGIATHTERVLRFLFQDEKQTSKLNLSGKNS